MAEVIRVVLADDHPALRVGLRVLLEQAPDVVVVGETGDGREALAQIEALQPEVAVLDCELPGMAGAEVAAEIQRRGLPTRVLALSAYDDTRYLYRMWGAGALGYMLKSEAPGVLVAAVRAAARREPIWTAEQLARVRRWQEAVEQQWQALTEREREVLALVAQGLSSKEIAPLLCLTVRTVDFHVSHILEKLGVGSRLEAVVWAKDHGFVG
jgi:DNA-binding NarL/FixJ family response regulator